MKFLEDIGPQRARSDMALVLAESLEEYAEKNEEACMVLEKCAAGIRSFFTMIDDTVAVPIKKRKRIGEPVVGTAAMKPLADEGADLTKEAEKDEKAEKEMKAAAAEKAEKEMKAPAAEMGPPARLLSEK